MPGRSDRQRRDFSGTVCASSRHEVCLLCCCRQRGFNFPELFRLRKKLEDAHAHYKIRVFEGEHGWAPAEVWDEALQWMDLQAMAAGTLPRDAQRIQAALVEQMARAQKFHADGDILESVREYQSVVRDFAALTDVSAAREQVAALIKDKAYKNAERDEADSVSRQAQLTSDISAQIAAIPSGLERWLTPNYAARWPTSKRTRMRRRS